MEAVAILVVIPVVTQAAAAADLIGMTPILKAKFVYVLFQFMYSNKKANVFLDSFYSNFIWVFSYSGLHI